jgi:hypothetical protein
VTAVVTGLLLGLCINLLLLLQLVQLRHERLGKLVQAFGALRHCQAV